MLKQTVAIKGGGWGGRFACTVSQFCKLFTLDFMTISPKVLYTGIKGG